MINFPPSLEFKLETIPSGNLQSWSDFEGLGRINMRPYALTQIAAQVKNVKLFGGRTNGLDAIQTKPLNYGSNRPKYGYAEILLDNVEIYDWAMSDPENWDKMPDGTPIKPHVDIWQVILDFDSRGIVPTIETRDCYFHDSDIDTLIQEGNAGLILFERHRIKNTHQGFKISQKEKTGGTIDRIIWKDCHDFDARLDGRVGGVKRVEFLRCSNYRLLSNEAQAEIFEETTSQYIDKLEKERQELSQKLLVANLEITKAAETIAKVETEKRELRAKALVGLEDAQKRMEELRNSL